jgi:hypothetical protein
MPQSSPSVGQALWLDGDVLEATQIHDEIKFADATIRLNMLVCNTSHDMPNQMDVMFGSDYENRMDLA